MGLHSHFGNSFIGVVIPLVVIVIVIIGHSRSTPLSPLQVTRDAIDDARL